MTRAACILLCLLVAGCSTYATHMAWENKLAPTPDITPEHRPVPKAWRDDGITYTWLGHASILINLYGTVILTDPVLLQRIAPPEMFNNALGVRRITRLPLALEELPQIDIVLISHPHFEHLDKASLERLGQLQEKPPLYIVPRDTADMVEPYTDGITELDWLPGSESVIDLDDATRIRAFRVEHYGHLPWSGRRESRGFNGYVISRNDSTIVFFGDTSFRRYRDENGELLDSPINVDWQGKFSIATINQRPDLCILPIGDSIYYWNHTSAEEALEIASRINCENILPIHYDTFILSPPDKQPPSMKQHFVDAAQPYVSRLSFACMTRDNQYRFPDIGVTCKLK